MVILGTAKCDQTSMGTDVMCKSSQLVYNYLLYASPSLMFCPVEWPFTGGSMGLNSFVRKKGLSPEKMPD